MDLGLDIPTDAFLADWLNKDSCSIKHLVEPICFLSRQERKTRRVKEHLQNYMFITQAEINFTVDRFRELLSAYLRLDYEFQLLKVESNRFILTLETQMSIDYACALLEEGRMVRLAQSDIICYPTDEYAEGYFGGDMAYHVDDEIAELHLDVQIHGLPLHLRTIKAVERILLRYCIVESVHDDCLSSKKLDYVQCVCWAQRGITLPKFVIIRVSSKFSYGSPVLSAMLQKHVQTYCVGVTVRLHGSVHPPGKYHAQNNESFARAAEGDRVGCCFLRDVDVSASRITELQDSILLKPKQFGLPTPIEEIAVGIQAAVSCTNAELKIQSIGVQGYIARSTGLPLPHLLREMIGAGNEISLCSQPFYWFPWTTSFGAVAEALPKKMNIQTSSLVNEFLAPAIVEDLLSPFCMFDTDGYDPGPSPDISSYSSVVWTNENWTIPWIIFVRAAPAFCETTEYQKGKAIDLTVMTAQNRGPGIEMHTYE